MKLGYGGKDNRGWIQAAIGEDGAISGFPEIPANGDNKLQGRCPGAEQKEVLNRLRLMGMTKRAKRIRAYTMTI